MRAYAEALWKKQGLKLSLPVRGLLAENMILCGRLDEALAMIAGPEGSQSGGEISIYGWVAVLRSDDSAGGDRGGTRVCQQD